MRKIFEEKKKQMIEIIYNNTMKNCGESWWTGAEQIKIYLRRWWFKYVLSLLICFSFWMTVILGPQMIVTIASHKIASVVNIHISQVASTMHTLMLGSEHSLRLSKWCTYRDLGILYTRKFPCFQNIPTQHNLQQIYWKPPIIFVLRVYKIKIIVLFPFWFNIIFCLGPFLTWNESA